jgi:hypothetical protein
MPGAGSEAPLDVKLPTLAEEGPVVLGRLAEGHGDIPLDVRYSAVSGVLAAFARREPEAADGDMLQRVSQLGFCAQVAEKPSSSSGESPDSSETPGRDVSLSGHKSSAAGVSADAEKR